jgi:hypothetical protein
MVQSLKFVEEASTQSLFVTLSLSLRRTLSSHCTSHHLKFQLDTNTIMHQCGARRSPARRGLRL